MDTIFHEKQEGYLCAQHCLNALLQGSYFNAVDLANLAQQMDEQERLRMLESGEESEDYRHFLEQPSGNVDDSGYFSVQVISKALEVWNLEMIPYNSTEPRALLAQNDPSQMKAYICNYKGHWFTVRKLGSQWFNLNSMLSGPQLISDTYLSMYLAQLIQEGYSIFLVIGTFPACDAEEYLSRHPVHSVPRSRTNSGHSRQNKNVALQDRTGSDKKLVEAALEGISDVQVPASLSMGIAGPSTLGSPILRNLPSLLKRGKAGADSSSSSSRKEKLIPVITIDGCGEEDDDDADLQRALQLSLEDNVEDTARPLALRLDLGRGENATHLLGEAEAEDEIEEEDDELRKALQLSLECVSTPPTSDQDDVRWRHVPILTMSRSNTESTQKLNT